MQWNRSSKFIGAMRVLTIEQVSKAYGTTEHPVLAVDGASMHLQAGELVALYGASGSGKTSLLMLAAGLETPDAGTVHFKEKNLAQMSARELTRYRRQQLGFVFQSFNLVPALSSLRNTVLPLLLDGADRGTAVKRARSLLRRVGLEDRESHRPHELSGGEQQRVAIARALVARPTLVLADEPTGNLDTVRGEEILTLLADLCRNEGAAVLLATHDVRAATYSDRILVTRDGRVHEADPLEAGPEGVVIQFPVA